KYTKDTKRRVESGLLFVLFVIRQQAAAVHAGQLFNYLFVTQTEMTVSAKQLLHQKIIEELHVDRRKTHRRVYVAVNRPATLQLLELRRIAPAQILRQAFK